MPHSVRDPVAPYIRCSLQYGSDLQTLTVHIADVLIPDRISRSGNIRAWIRSQLTMHPTVNSASPPPYLQSALVQRMDAPAGALSAPVGAIWGAVMVLLVWGAVVISKVQSETREFSRKCAL